MIHGRAPVVPTFIMNLERNVIIAIVMGIILNEKISIMEQIKFDKLSF